MFHVAWGWDFRSRFPGWLGIWFISCCCTHRMWVYLRTGRTWHSSCRCWIAVIFTQPVATLRAMFSTPAISRCEYSQQLDSIQGMLFLGLAWQKLQLLTIVSFCCPQLVPLCFEYVNTIPCFAAGSKDMRAPV